MMSDVDYESKVIAQRNQMLDEMRECEACLSSSPPSMAMHIAAHREDLPKEVTVYTPSPIQAELCASYPHKAKGMPDAASMHKSKWSRPSASGPREARQSMSPADFDKLERPK